MKTDIEIALEAKKKPVKDIAADLGIGEDMLEYYGKYKAKLSEELYAETASRPDGKLILVTAINPTPAGEGKTTVSVGLGQALAKLGKRMWMWDDFFDGPGFRHQRQSRRRRLLSGRADGGHQPSLHRRYARADRGK